MAGTNKALIVPNKDSPKLSQPEEGTNYRAIEQWANSLKEASGGAYASLTGPGETVTPGLLEQQGDFAIFGSDGALLALYDGVLEATGLSNGVNINDSSVSGIQLQEGGSGTIEILNSGTATTGITLDSTGTIEIGGGYGEGVSLLGPVTITQLNGGLMGQSVIGSRGGNVALANLLTALDALGIIVDHTSA